MSRSSSSRSSRAGAPSCSSRTRADDSRGGADRAQAERRRAFRRGDLGAHPRLHPGRRAGLPNGRVVHGRLLQGPFRARTARPDRRDDSLRRDARPRCSARPQGRRQAFDGRRGRQDVTRRRPDRRRVRCSVREDVGARTRSYGRDARQARVDTRLPRRADHRRIRLPGSRYRPRDHRADGRPRSGGQEAVFASRCDRDRGHRPADRIVDHVQEARRWRRRDRPRREGRRRRVHEDARRRQDPLRADGRPRPSRRPSGRMPTDRHGPAARRSRRERARGARGGVDDHGRGATGPHRARTRLPAPACSRSRTSASTPKRGERWPSRR